MKAALPNLLDRTYMLRPTQFFSDPPLCTLQELRDTYTLDDLADMHEILDYREAEVDRIQRELERERDNRNPRGRRR